MDWWEIWNDVMAGPRVEIVEIWASMEAVLQCVADVQLTSAYDAMPQETIDPTLEAQLLSSCKHKGISILRCKAQVHLCKENS